MTRPRRTAKEIELVKMQLADIIEDEFTKNGQVVTHERLARRHVLRNGSVTAAEDVALYGGSAVAYLRREKRFAIVPITAKFPDWEADPEVEQNMVNAVAGLGAGGTRIGWYQPIDRDDWLWVYYIGHLAKAGVAAVFHAGQQIDKNTHLNTGKTRAAVADLATRGLPVPPGTAEVKVLQERAKQ